MKTRIAVWIARLIVGATFTVSGMAKMIDLYGSVNKFNDYFAAWGIAELFPEGLVLMAAAALCMAEFLTGFTLLTGSMRRTSAICATAIMAVMLPLSAYIWIADPVSDCGCFGDWLIISNLATFLKNIFLSALCVFLLLTNRCAPCLFAPWVQWMQIAVAVAYCGLIGIIGYNEQPLVDFRPYPIGSRLYDPDASAPEPIYVYRTLSTGEIHEFSMYDLPDDDTPDLEFIEVRQPIANPVGTNTFAILDPDSGMDVTDDVVNSDSTQLFLLIPDLKAAGAAISFNANELAARADLIALTDASAEEIDTWRDISMADYPIYRADSRTLKTIARGKTAIVDTEGGIITWKRTLQSIDPETEDLSIYAAPSRFPRFTIFFLLVEAAILIIGYLPRLLRLRLKNEKRGK